jgi:pimeloyl-ACP methyl ester carboxylesterase
MWRHTIDHFQTLRPVIAPNAADLISDGATMEHIADLAALALDAVEEGCGAIVVGLSMGGYIAAEFAARFPKRLLGLVLCDTRASAETPEGRVARDAMIASVRSHGVVHGTAPLVAKILHDPSRALAAEVAKMVEEQDPDSVVACIEAMRDRRDHNATIRALNIPFLVLSGENDVLAPVEVEQATAALNPRGRYVHIPKSGHVPPLENPAAFNDALDEFLGSDLGVSSS